MSHTAVAPPGTAEPPPPLSVLRPEVGNLSDADLVDLAVSSQVTENAFRARRLGAIYQHHARAVARGGEPCPADPSFFILTPLQATTSEFGPALTVTDHTIAAQLDLTCKLVGWFPNIWAMCESGRLDLGRAGLLLDAVGSFASEADIPRFASRMDDYIARYDDRTAPLCTISYSQLQRAARYRKLKFEQRNDQDSFAAAFQRRRLSFRPGEDGIGSLYVRHRITDAMTADYRVTLIAKRMQRQDPDETRTLEQLRADVTLDLLLGRLEVTATNAMLEAAEDPSDAADRGDPVGEGAEKWFGYHKAGAFARPIINVTVPIQSLLGLSDAPGCVSGANPIPAELVRAIAADPDSTWFRMLTDPTRECAELSTTSYQPTRPIWRQVVARDQICLWPACSRPAVRVELDHRLEYPAGATSTDNLGPLCRRHHKVKHSRGFQLSRNHDSSYTWSTRTGHTFKTRPCEQPDADWPAPETVAPLA